VWRAAARGRARCAAADQLAGELVRAVRVLGSGDAVLSPSLTSQLIARWLDASETALAAVAAAAPGLSVDVGL